MSIRGSNTFLCTCTSWIDAPNIVNTVQCNHNCVVILYLTQGLLRAANVSSPNLHLTSNYIICSYFMIKHDRGLEYTRILKYTRILEYTQINLTFEASNRSIIQLVLLDSYYSTCITQIDQLFDLNHSNTYSRPRIYSNRFIRVIWVTRIHSNILFK